MTPGRKRSALSYIPGFTNNAVLQLIIFLSVAYVILALTWGVMMLVYRDGSWFNIYFLGNIGLPPVSAFRNHFWTIFTYGIFNFPNGFWELVSNMLWLYCFGSVVQMLVGHRQVIPLFLYALVAGCALCLLIQFIPGEIGKAPMVILGPRAGLMGLAAAAVTLTPNYRFYLTETFSIPILAVAGIFTVLTILASGYYVPVILMIAGGGLMGFAYVRLLRAGFRPGDWMYQLTGKIASIVTPDENAPVFKQPKSDARVLNRKYEPRQGISQKKIDDILDKINQKGYKALSAEEKEMLMRAGKE